MEPHWAFVLEYDEWISRTAKRFARGRSDWAEQLYEELVDRTENAFRTWDSAKGPLLPHIFNTLKLYAWKFCQVEHRRLQRFSERPVYEDDPCPCGDEHKNVDLADEVLFLIGTLDEQERQALVLRHVAGMTFDELAAVLHVSRGEAKRTYERALARARETAAQKDMEI